MTPLPPRSTLFPYPTLFRSRFHLEGVSPLSVPSQGERKKPVALSGGPEDRRPAAVSEEHACRDRKSTRLNSSHSSISYAVFCLKKKNSYQPKSLRSKRLKIQ